MGCLQHNSKGNAGRKFVLDAYRTPCACFAVKVSRK